MGANTLQLKRTPIPDTILKRIYDSDQEMYPAPLTYERLKSWIDGCPELSICFETIPGEGTNTVPVGAVIVLPVVKMYWDDLVLGRLKETDIDAATMFPGGGGEVDVGLHVFHIERFDAGTRITKVRNFAQVALESVRDIVRKRAWNVIGHSALTATPSGREAFKRMDFKPTGYEELFLRGYIGGAGERGNVIYVYPDKEKPTYERYGKFRGKSEMVIRCSNGGF